MLWLGAILTRETAVALVPDGFESTATCPCSSALVGKEWRTRRDRLLTSWLVVTTARSPLSGERRA